MEGVSFRDTPHVLHSTSSGRNVTPSSPRAAALSKRTLVSMPSRSKSDLKMTQKKKRFIVIPIIIIILGRSQLGWPVVVSVPPQEESGAPRTHTRT
jgi:hypothetical protein